MFVCKLSYCGRVAKDAFKQQFPLLNVREDCMGCLNSHIERHLDGATFEVFFLLFLQTPLHPLLKRASHAMLQYTWSLRGLREEKANRPFLHLEQGRTIIVINIIIPLPQPRYTAVKLVVQ